MIDHTLVKTNPFFFGLTLSGSRKNKYINDRLISKKLGIVFLKMLAFNSYLCLPGVVRSYKYTRFAHQMSRLIRSASLPSSKTATQMNKGFHSACPKSSITLPTCTLDSSKTFLKRKKLVFDTSVRLSLAALNASSEIQKAKAGEGLKLVEKVIMKYSSLKTLKGVSKSTGELTIDTSKRVPIVSKHLNTDQLKSLSNMYSKLITKSCANPHKSKLFVLESLAFELPIILCKLRLLENSLPKDKATSKFSYRFFNSIIKWANLPQRNIKVGYRIKESALNLIESKLNK